MRSKGAENMRKYLKEYIAWLEELLDATTENIDFDELEERHLHMVQFMQHERLIHFLVTMLFTLGFFIVLAVYLTAEMIMLLPLLILILALLIPYIAHYYFLENSVQKLYRMYDEIHHRRMQKQKAAEPKEGE